MSEFPRRRSDPGRWKQGRPTTPRRSPPAKTPASNTAWERQAAWYDERQGQEGDDFHRDLVLPAVLRQLQAQPGQRVLDCCCGNGVLGRHLAATGVRVVGVDASPSLIESAQERAGSHESYVLGDAHALPDLLSGESFDHAALVLALQDLDPINHVLHGCAQAVRPGGRLVVVLTHPCFRLPKYHHWGWDEENELQYRRLDGYALPRRLPIVTHPGRDGNTASTTSYHRALPLYLNALGAAGWAVTASEELFSHRRGSKGRRSQAEDLAHREFPVFLVLTAQRLSSAPAD